MKAVWAEGLSGEMNLLLAFVLDFGRKVQGRIALAAASCYKLYADERLLGAGPQRAARGYARRSRYRFTAKVLTVLVASYNVKNFCQIKQPPFFAAEVVLPDGRKFSSGDFSCFQLFERVQRVPRYSYQRGFEEVYRIGSMPHVPVRTVEVCCPQLLPCRTGNVRFKLLSPRCIAERGEVLTDPAAPPWRDRAHTEVGEGSVEGFPIWQWEESPIDEASRFRCKQGGTGGLNYVLYDFGRVVTGFCELTVRSPRGGSVFVLFDEVLTDGTVDFRRNACASVHKWTVGAGDFRVATFEPYAMRYACVVCTQGTEAEIFCRLFENPAAGRFSFTCADTRIAQVVEAARATLAQNSVDILTDCPSRERAGWLSDSWFSSVAERCFTGSNTAERAFLENYLYAEEEGLPRGMIPMCYPADTIGGQFIPNWAMWYILELEKYAALHPNDRLPAKSKGKVYGILNYFRAFENEYGLLEDLAGWVFVEWSEANAPDHVRGVNLPSNICYAAALAAAGKLYKDDALLARSEKIMRSVRELGFDGTYFTDNLVRKDGKLAGGGNYTEVCQYYAFWFGCATREEYGELYERLLAPRKVGEPLQGLAAPNAMYGLYMRFDLLMRAGRGEQLLAECMELFGGMAERTGTLWEHNGALASCCHGFASYAVRWILYALSGVDILAAPRICGEAGIVDCAFRLPFAGGVSVTVKGGKRTVR